MRHLIQSTLMLLTLSVVTVASAQSADPSQAAPQPPQGQYHHHMPNPQHQTRMLTHRLGLTPDQAAQVEPILAARDQQMQALHQNPPADPQAIHQQMHSIHQDTDAKLNAIFNDQQKQQYAQMESYHHHGHHGQQPSQQPNPAV